MSGHFGMQAGKYSSPSASACSVVHFLKAAIILLPSCSFVFKRDHNLHDCIWNVQSIAIALVLIDVSRKILINEIIQ